MVRSWISAAAAAGTLSAGIPSGVAPSFTPSRLEAPTFAAPRTERARIMGIATEVRRLVGRYAEAETSEIVAPRPLRELGVHGLALADVVLGLEARFDIDIEEADVASWVTVGDVVGFVARRAPRTAAFTTA